MTRTSEIQQDNGVSTDQGLWSQGVSNEKHSAVSPMRVRGARSLWVRMLRQQRLYWLMLLAVSELGLLTFAAVLAAALSLPAGADASLYAGAMPFVIVSWGALISLGLYERHSEHTSEFRAGMTARVFAALASASLASLLAGWLIGAPAIVPFTIAMAAISSVLLLISRLTFARIAGNPYLRRKTLFLGAGTQASRVVQRMQSPEAAALSRSLNIVGFFSLDSDVTALADRRRISSCEQLSAFAHEHEVDEIVIAADDRRSTLPMDELLRCRINGITVLDLDAFYEREFGKTVLELIQPSWCVFSRTFDTSAVREISKRGFDLCASLLLIMILWPAMLLVALLILLEARGQGPVFYVQQRVGRNGSVFSLFKFRSMRTDAELDGVARFAQSEDTRITRVGRFIRKVRLDELPQLWNVLRGDMSMVGPRPERPEFVDGFNTRIPHYSLRHSVRPGLSGWAQLRFPYGASEADTIEKLRYDLYYVKFQSFALDLSILLQTAEVVLFGRGAR